MARHAAKVRPQSGSHNRPTPDSRSHQEQATTQQAPSSVHPVEPEDAYLTGTSRSLQRRVLGLNVNGGGQSQPHPQQVPGQHATGSYSASGSRRNRN